MTDLLHIRVIGIRRRTGSSHSGPSEDDANDPYRSLAVTGYCGSSKWKRGRDTFDDVILNLDRKQRRLELLFGKENLI
ncbi:hypothetical protein MHYP_G00302690 [Metynnis hypsauchen]